VRTAETIQIKSHQCIDKKTSSAVVHLFICSYRRRPHIADGCDRILRGRGRKCAEADAEPKIISASAYLWRLMRTADVSANSSWSRLGVTVTVTLTECQLKMALFDGPHRIYTSFYSSLSSNVTEIFSVEYWRDRVTLKSQLVRGSLRSSRMALIEIRSYTSSDFLQASDG